MQLQQTDLLPWADPYIRELLDEFQPGSHRSAPRQEAMPPLYNPTPDFDLPRRSGDVLPDDSRDAE